MYKLIIIGSPHQIKIFYHTNQLKLLFLLYTFIILSTHYMAYFHIFSGCIQIPALNIMYKLMFGVFASILNNNSVSWLHFQIVWVQYKTEK